MIGRAAVLSGAPGRVEIVFGAGAVQRGIFSDRPPKLRTIVEWQVKSGSGTPARFNCARRIAPLWENAAHALKGAPHVADIRNIGLLAAIDLKSRDGATGARGAECANRCYDDDILIRSSGDTLLISPPLIITEDQIEAIFSAIRRALIAID